MNVWVTEISAEGKESCIKAAALWPPGYAPYAIIPLISKLENAGKAGAPGHGFH